MLKRGIVLMALAFTAQADVFRCDVGGRTVYTDQASERCTAVPIRYEAPDPEALLRAQRNREAYEQSMAEWRERYDRSIEQRTATLQAQAQRPIIIYTPPQEPAKPVYLAYPASPFPPGFKHPGSRKHTRVQPGPARLK
ncbi:hypothetical protein [Methylocaldum szegediense]|uniref:hypothetical protein n=1 Tax=Methylocaldum szegediense TaxID=73780 RepID=UPI00041CB6B3|nr:hypothetical protein [Methylocaldum szegediense]